MDCGDERQSNQNRESEAKFSRPTRHFSASPYIPLRNEKISNKKHKAIKAFHRFRRVMRWIPDPKIHDDDVS